MKRIISIMELSSLRLTKAQLLSVRPIKCNDCWRSEEAADELLQEARLGNITEEDACDTYAAIGGRCLHGLKQVEGSGEYFCTNPQLLIDQTPPLP